MHALVLGWNPFQPISENLMPENTPPLHYSAATEETLRRLVAKAVGEHISSLNDEQLLAMLKRPLQEG
jgi:hypothetical protein